MKNNKALIITVICLISVAIIALIAFLVMSIKGNFSFNNFNFIDEISEELLFEEEYDNIFVDIKIDTNSADIEILNSENDKVKVTIYADKDKLKTNNINTNNNILNVDLKLKECVGFCFNRKSKVTIYLPETYDKNITIKNNYGDIKIENFSNSIINIQEDCGDVYVESAKEANIANNYGDVKIDTINEHLDITSDCGDVKIDTINLLKNSNITNNLGDVKIQNIKDVYIDAKTDLGDVKINNNYHKSDIVLNIQNDCGDIKVEN